MAEKCGCPLRRSWLAAPRGGSQGAHEVADVDFAEGGALPLLPAAAEELELGGEAEEEEDAQAERDLLV